MPVELLEGGLAQARPRLVREVLHLGAPAVVRAFGAHLVPRGHEDIDVERRLAEERRPQGRVDGREVVPELPGEAERAV